MTGALFQVSVANGLMRNWPLLRFQKPLNLLTEKPEWFCIRTEAASSRQKSLLNIAKIMAFLRAWVNPDARMTMLQWSDTSIRWRLNLSICIPIGLKLSCMKKSQLMPMVGTTTRDHTLSMEVFLQPKLFKKWQSHYNFAWPVQQMVQKYQIRSHWCIFCNYHQQKRLRK